MSGFMTDEVTIAAAAHAPERSFGNAAQDTRANGLTDGRKLLMRCVAGGIAGGVGAAIGGLFPLWLGIAAGLTLPLAGRCVIKAMHREPDKISTRLHHNILIVSTAAALAAPALMR